MSLPDASGPATLHYADGEFAVLRPGKFVPCSVSGRPIPLEALKYWSASLQEPYFGAAEALSRLAPRAG